MKRFWQIANILSVVFALVWNFLTGAQVLDLPAIGEISDKYATFLTPATYAFSIWSLVYILMIVFAIYQARDLFTPDKANDLPAKIGPFFIIANICNGLWTYIFVQEYIGLSVFILLALSASLFALIVRLKIANFDAPRSVIAGVWWPILIYTGWVSVATVVNIASWYISVGGEITPIIAVLVLLGLLVALLWLLKTRNVRELLLASAWGIAAIGVNQLSDNSLVMATAFSVSAILLIAISIHGYHNRKTNPFFKAKS